MTTEAQEPSEGRTEDVTPEVDCTVENHGTIFLFRPCTEAANTWLHEHTDEDAQWFGGALAVNHGYARDLADALIDDGLVVR